MKGDLQLVSFLYLPILIVYSKIYLSSFPKESPVCQSKDKQPPFTHYSSVIQDKYINSFLSL